MADGAGSGGSRAQGFAMTCAGSPGHRRLLPAGSQQKRNQSKAQESKSLLATGRDSPHASSLTRSLATPPLIHQVVSDGVDVGPGVFPLPQALLRSTSFT